MFVNCLSERIRHSKLHFYADDLQIYLSGNRSDLDGLIARVNATSYKLITNATYLISKLYETMII
jgi:hypothetical protein